MSRDKSKHWSCALARPKIPRSRIHTASNPVLPHDSSQSPLRSRTPVRRLVCFGRGVSHPKRASPGALSPVSDVCSHPTTVGTARQAWCKRACNDGTAGDTWCGSGCNAAAAGAVGWRAGQRTSASGFRRRRGAFTMTKRQHAISGASRPPTKRATCSKKEFLSCRRRFRRKARCIEIPSACRGVRRERGKDLKTCRSAAATFHDLASLLSW